MPQPIAIEVAVAGLMTSAAAIFAATWPTSPFRLPLPPSRLNPFLRGVPLLATVVIVAILTWFMDCLYMTPLATIAIASLVLCVSLLLSHALREERGAGSKLMLILLCYGWSISGVLSVCSTATWWIAKTKMDEAYAAHPLTLWRLIDGRREKPVAPIYLTSKLPAHFRAELDDCHEDTAPLEIKPAIGRLKDGDTYYAPDFIAEEQQIKLTAYSKRQHDIRSAAIILLPDAPGITRKTYPIVDKDGRGGTLDLIVIANTDSWVYESETHIEPNGLPATATPVCRAIQTLATSHAFTPYVDIVAVGTASREGRQAEEDGRAGRRARNIARWVNYALQSTAQRKHVYFLNLGQYRRGNRENSALDTSATAPERPVVILGLVHAGPIDIGAAIDHVLRRNQNDPFFRFIASHYPRRDVVEFGESPVKACE